MKSSLCYDDWQRKRMSAPVAAVNLTTADTPAAGTSRLDRRLFLILAAIALVYAFLAGLRTTFRFRPWLAVGDGTLGGSNITSVSSTDVFSYTAQGEPWIYPVGSGLVLYATYLLGGYTLISWLGALACVATVALLLRRGSAVSAGIAILAVPLIAWRTTPRADMFTVVLFAAFLSLLWENYQTGQARLWLLPLLMVAWVNLHFGFAAGLALILAYVGVELSETIFGNERRRAAMQRLRQCMGMAGVDGAGYAGKSVGLGDLSGPAAARASGGAAAVEYRRVEQCADDLDRLQHCAFVEADPRRDLSAAGHRGGRWRAGVAQAPIGSGNPAARRNLSAGPPCSHGSHICVRGRGGWRARSDCGDRRIRRQDSAATNAFDCCMGRGLLAGSARFVALFRSGHQSSLLFGLWMNRHSAPDWAGGSRNVRRSSSSARTCRERSSTLTTKAVTSPGSSARSAAITSTAATRSSEYRGCTGPASCSNSRPIPRRGSRKPTATTSTPSFFRWRALMASSCCSSTAFATVVTGGRCIWTKSPPSSCVVQPETEALIQRFPVDCATATLPVPPLDYSAAGSFNQSANAANLLAVLGRNTEALAASDNALQSFPDSPFVHWLRGNILSAMGSRSEAEQEYVTAISLEPSEVAWNSPGLLVSA